MFYLFMRKEYADYYQVMSLFGFEFNIPALVN